MNLFAADVRLFVHDDGVLLCLRPGRVRGQGDDEVGAFVISGTYSGSKVTFVKDYIGQHSVQYDGKLSVPSPGSFDLVGRWSIGPRLSDRFEMSGRPS